MYEDTHQSFAYRFLRSLLPSPISGVLCCCFGAGVVIVYLIILSVSIGTSLPDLFEGEWAPAYTNTIVRPLLLVFNDLTLGKILILLMWGALGLICYLLLEYGAYTYRNWRRTEGDIQMVGTRVIQHPARRWFITAALWRTGVLITFLLTFIFFTQLPIRQLPPLAPEILLGHLSLGQSIGRILPIIGALILLSHLFVVFLRLFTMRVRLFGEEPM